MLDLILDLYRVEHAALMRASSASPSTSALRTSRALPILGRIRDWLVTHGPLTRRSLLWARRCATHAASGRRSAASSTTPHCRSTTTLRRTRSAPSPSVGRTSSSSGHDEAGAGLAGLYSLVATCEANGVNPEAYLADVLLRVQSHPAARIDELLPDRWMPPAPNTS